MLLHRESESRQINATIVGARSQIAGNSGSIGSQSGRGSSDVPHSSKHVLRCPADRRDPGWNPIETASTRPRAAQPELSHLRLTHRD
jgi:hypothetical protein